jgi:hypothetical protein
MLTPNRVALVTAGLLDVAALCASLAGVVPGSAARAVVAVGAVASAAAKAVTFAVGSWKQPADEEGPGDPDALPHIITMTPGQVPPDQGDAGAVTA